MRERNFLKLRGAVTENGYTLGDFAKKLNLTPQGLNEKLQGRNPFTLDEMLAACNLFNAPIDIFFDPKLHNLQFLGQTRTA